MERRDLTATKLSRRCYQEWWSGYIAQVHFVGPDEWDLLIYIKQYRRELHSVYKREKNLLTIN